MPWDRGAALRRCVGAGARAFEPRPRCPPMNLPTERLVLAFGCGIAAAAYAYWTVEAHRLGLGWTPVASARAAVVLAGTLLLALVLRAAARANPPPDP